LNYLLAYLLSDVIVTR